MTRPSTYFLSNTKQNYFRALSLQAKIQVLTNVPILKQKKPPYKEIFLCQ